MGHLEGADHTSEWLCGKINVRSGLLVMGVIDGKCAVWIEHHDVGSSVLALASGFELTCLKAKVCDHASPFLFKQLLACRFNVEHQQQCPLIACYGLLLVCIVQYNSCRSAHSVINGIFLFQLHDSRAMHIVFLFLSTVLSCSLFMA